MLTRDWGKSILRRMGFVKRRTSTSAKVSVENFEVLKAQYLFDIKVIIEMEEIPYKLVINWDQTAIHYVPVGSWTMEKEGTQRVEIVGKDDKCQITAVLAGSLTGDFLPPQLVYQGMTKRCIPTVNFPQDWDINFSSNHWSNASQKTEKEKGHVCSILHTSLCPLLERPTSLLSVGKGLQTPFG